MCHTGKSRSCSTPFLPLLCVSLCLTAALAQKVPEPSPPKYDLHAETKLKGSVEEVLLPPKGNDKVIVHLSVKTGTDTVDVYLCPKSFLDDMGVSFGKGDESVLPVRKLSRAKRTSSWHAKW